jgi:hypothetical protein
MRRRLIRGPIRPDRWSALRFATLRWAALPVIDRRWTVPLAALALAFGIFVGVAIGPSQGIGSEQTSSVVQVVPPPDTTVASTNTPGGNANNHGNGGGPTPSTPTPPTDNGPFDTPPVSTPPPTTPATPPPTTTTPTATTTPTTTTTTTTTTPTTPTTASVKGPVVHVNRLAGSYTVARSGGKLYSVHSSSLPNLGDVVSVEARVLANGTWAEDGDRSRTDGAQQVDLEGTVTFSDPRIGAYSVSANGSSILVRVKPGVRMPQVADKVSVTARIANKLDPIEPLDAGRDGCGKPPNLPKAQKVALQQVSLKVTDSASNTDLEGIVQGVCRKAGSLILSADDLRESGRDIAVTVPNDLRLAKIDIGQMLKIRADIGSSGNFTAKKIADDERQSGANDESRIQP